MPRRRRGPALSADWLEDRQLLAAPLVTYHQGNPGILASVQIVPIFYGWDKTSDPNLGGTPAQILAFQNQLDTFLSDLSGSSYLGNLAEYGVGTGTVIQANGKPFDAVPFPSTPATITPTQNLLVPVGGQTVVYPANKPITNVISDNNSNGINDPNNIQAMITGEIGKGNVPNSVAGTTLYWVWTPPGINVFFANGQPTTAMSNATFGGYHNWTKNGNQFAYAVMPYPNANTLDRAGIDYPIDYITALSSHELGEGVTDPYGTGWFYMNTGGEIGDLLDGQNVWFTPMQAAATGTTYYVQLLWSNFIALSTYPHTEPLVGGNPSLPGNVNSPSATVRRSPTNFQPSPPTSSPPPTPPNQPASPTLPTPTPPRPPIHTGPSIPGGGALVQPVIVSSPYNANDLAVGSQNGVIISTNAGASWSTPIATPASFGGDTSLVYDKNGNLYWSYLNTTTGGVSIETLNPSTGAVVAGPFTVDAPASGSTDVQQFLAADYSQASSTSNNIAIVWTQLGPSGSSKILLSLSANQGKTWLPPTTVAASGGGTPPTYYYGATVTFSINGNLDVAYHAQPGYTVASDGGIVPDGLSGQTLVAVYAYSSSSLNQVGTTITAFGAGDSDITFNDQAGTRTIAGTTFLTQGSAVPQILADPSRPGTVYVIATEDPDAGTANPPSSEVVIATLTQGTGGTWSVTTATIAAPSSSSVFQLFPTASIDASGDIVVSWYTNASGLKNAAGDYLLDTDATYSIDGGVTWATPFPVDTRPFDPDAGAPDVLPGPPPTTSIGNGFGVAIVGGTVFVANDVNSFTGTTPTGQQVGVESFLLPGTLFIPTALGNNVITIGQQSSNSGIDVVQINGVTVYVGSIAGLAGGIIVGNGNFLGDDMGLPTPGSAENDTLILNYANGDPVPAGGIDFAAAENGSNLIEVNADANYTLSDSSLTIGGNAVTGTDTITLDDVNHAQLTGGPSNDTFTLDGWSGTTTINGGTGTAALVVAGGTVQTSGLTVTNVPTLSVTGGTFDVNASFASIPTVMTSGMGVLELDNGVTLTANVTNGGTLMLGSGTSTADATISGNFMQSSTGTLDIKLGGTTAGQFDQLNVTGNVSLAGTLDVSLVNSYVPATGDSMQIITYMGALTGDFTTKNFPTLGNGNMFTTSSGNGSYTLTVTT